MKGNDMTNELKNILESAQTWYVASMREFSNMQKAEKEKDEYMSNVYWAICQEYSGKADGLLLAYAIITGRSLYQWQIEDELKLIA